MSILWDRKLNIETYCRVFPDRSLPSKSKNQLGQNRVPSCGTINFISMELNGTLTARHERGGQLCIDLAREYCISCDEHCLKP